MMTPDATAIRTYFAKLGLESEIADLYLALHLHGPQTISALSRTSHVERTRIYRLIDKLMASNLVEVESHYKRGIIKAAPITNLRILINEREQELKNLTDELSLVEQVLARNSLSSPTTRVQFYNGAEGYKQMLWNETNAHTDIQGLCYEIMQPKTKQAFYERYTRAINDNNITIRELYGDQFVQSKKAWYADHDNIHFNHYEARYLPSSIYPLQYSVDVYDDVTAYFQWKDTEIFAFEIYNQQIADSQRALFAMLWKQTLTDQSAT